jgi:hypothetical protein
LRSRTRGRYEKRIREVEYEVKNKISPRTLHWGITDDGSVGIRRQNFNARTDESSEELVARWGILKRSIFFSKWKELYDEWCDEQYP